MKAEELRIGNLVKMPSSGSLTTITAMDISDIQSNLKNRLPVELSEEILLKCWFEQVKNFQEGTLGLNGIRMVEHLGEWQWNDFSRNKKVPYLHELQNLYFALTGEELDVSKIVDHG